MSLVWPIGDTRVGREVLSCYLSGAEEVAGPGEPRPEHAPVPPLMRRYGAKAAELGVSMRTVKR
jgi:hypothetical protein